MSSNDEQPPQPVDEGVVEELDLDPDLQAEPEAPRPPPLPPPLPAAEAPLANLAVEAVPPALPTDDSVPIEVPEEEASLELIEDAVSAPLVTTVATPVEPPEPSMIAEARALLEKEDWSERVALYEREIALESDAERQAVLAFEIGELEQFAGGNEGAALKSYGRAFALHPALKPNLWAIRGICQRRGLWPNLLKVLEAELHYAASASEKAELLVEKAQILEDKLGDLAAARQALEQAAGEDPSSLAALLALERIASRNGDRYLGARVIERMATCAANPVRKIVLLLELAALRATEDIDAAMGTLREAHSLGVERERVIDAMERLATRTDRATDLLEALDLRVALLEATGDERSHESIAEVRRRQAQVVRRTERGAAAAWDYLERARAALADEPLLFDDLAELAEALGRWDDLATLTTRRLEGARDEDRPALLWKLALAFERDGKGEQAARIEQELEAMEPSALPLWVARQQRLVAAGDDVRLAKLHREEAELARAAGETGWQARAWVDAGLAHERSGDAAQAMDAYRQALSTAPGGVAPDVLMRLARLHVGAERWREAADCLAEASRRLGAASPIPLDLGRAELVERRLGDREAALAILEGLRERTADAVETRVMRPTARILRELDRKAELAALLERWVPGAAIADRAPLLSELTELYASLGRSDDAISCQRRQLAEVPSAEAELRMAELAEEQGAIDEAAGVYGRIAAHGDEWRLHAALGRYRLAARRSDLAGLEEASRALGVAGTAAAQLFPGRSWLDGLADEPAWLSKLAPSIDEGEMASALRSRAAWLAAARGAAPSELAGLIGASSIDGETAFALSELAPTPEALAARARDAEGDTHVEWTIEQIETLEATGQLAEAAAVASSALGRSPAHIGLLETARRLAAAAGDRAAHARASAALACLLGQDGPAIVLLREAAQELERVGDPTSAIGAWRWLLARAPADDEASARARALLEANGDFQTLEDLLTRRIGLAGRSPAARADELIARGKVRERLGQPGPARLDYRAALEIDGTHAEGLRRLGMLLATHGDRAGAITHLQQFTRIAGDPKQLFEAFDKLGELHASAGDSGRSLIALERALELAPENLEVMERLAQTYLDQREPRRAMEMLSRLMERDPLRSAALEKLVALCRAHGERGWEERILEGSEEAAEAALAAAERETAAFRTLERVFFFQGDEERCHLASHAAALAAGERPVAADGEVPAPSRSLAEPDWRSGLGPQAAGVELDIWQAARECAAKRYGRDVTAHGLGKGDRLSSKARADQWRAVDAVVRALGGGDWDIYRAGDAERIAVVGDALLVGQAFADPLSPRLRFRLAHALALGREQLGLLKNVDAEELERFFGACAYAAGAAWRRGDGRANEEIAKGFDRRSRKALQSRQACFERVGDLESWRRAVFDGAARLALAGAGDLAAACAELELSGDEGKALRRFAVSDAMVSLRRALGMRGEGRRGAR